MKNSLIHILKYIENRQTEYKENLDVEVSYSVITETRQRLHELSDLHKFVSDELIRLSVCDTPLIDKTALSDEWLICEASDDNVDWIPVKLDLPKQRNSMFAKFKRTCKWRAGMFEKISDEVLVTVMYEDGSKKCTTSYLVDSEWEIERKPRIHKCKVLAWRPMPSVY